MRFLISLSICLFVLFACDNATQEDAHHSIDWKTRSIPKEEIDSLSQGQTYLSLYSQVYSRSQHRKHDLTAMVSMRNVNTTDTVYVSSAKYYDTHGKLIRTYLNEPIFIAPMETVEIIIDEDDQSGGTGANFMFDWFASKNSNQPYFEAVMISTTGHQGLSFTTQGIQVR